MCEPFCWSLISQVLCPEIMFYGLWTSPFFPVDTDVMLALQVVRTKGKFTYSGAWFQVEAQHMFQTCLFFYVRFCISSVYRIWVDQSNLYFRRFYYFTEPVLNLDVSCVYIFRLIDSHSFTNLSWSCTCLATISFLSLQFQSLFSSPQLTLQWTHSVVDHWCKTLFAFMATGMTRLRVLFILSCMTGTIPKVLLYLFI